jgi:hypothetical protein
LELDFCIFSLSSRMLFFDIKKNVPNVLISKECVSEDDGNVDGASVYTPKNSDHVLKDSRTGEFLSACVVQKKTGTKELWFQMTNANYSGADASCQEQTGFIQQLRSYDQHPVLTGDSILPRASLKASLCCCCCCVTLWAAAFGSCSGYLSVPRDLGGRDSEGLVFTSVGCKNHQAGYKG